ncbi:MAG: TfoX/Sxy family protein [Candidatus Heimdallarchaeota archaeon]|nr:TfoX/Sxy family protein [Candidatus Heimdallarchaeota archaeon]
MSKNEYAEEIREKLGFLGPITTKNMFGTIAFVRDGVFFGSISKGTLYFKTDETSIKQYEKYNMTPFSTRGISMDYFEVPQEILTNDKLFQEWAEIALNAAIKKKK